MISFFQRVAFFEVVMDAIVDVLETIFAAIWYIAWRFFLIYCLYVNKGPKAVSKAFGMALAIVIILGTTGALDMTNRLWHLEYYFNAMVFSSVFLLGYIGFWKSVLLFSLGYSTTREGGFINRILKGDKE